METNTCTQSQSYNHSTVPPALQMDQTVYGKIIEAVAYFEENELGNPIGIGAVCGRSKQTVVDVKNVLYSLLYSGRLLPSFRPYCKSCGDLGDRATSVNDISDTCRCCYMKIMKIIEFWPAKHRPDFQ